MNKFNAYISWVVSLAVFILFEEIIQFPKFIWVFAPIALILVIGGIWHLTGREVKIKKFWNYIITPTMFLLGGLLFLGFLEGRFIKQIFILGFAILLWAYLQVVFLRFHFRPKYEPYSLENMTIHLNLIAVYLLASGFYSLILFLNINYWLLAGGFFLVSLLVSSQVVWASSTTVSSGWPYILVMTLALGQVYLAASYLPTSVYVNGLLVALTFYATGGIFRNWLLEIKNKNVFYRYLLISLISAIIILLTAKWF